MAATFSPFDSDAQRRKRLWLSAAALVGVLLWGTFGLMWIEGWDFSKALYFTLITVTTVGYGDEGISPAGRVFALVFLVIGIAVCSYSFAYLVQSMVASNLSWRRRMQ